MQELREIRFLLGKELLLEFRNKTATSSILLYIISTIYVSYLSFRKITDIPTWNALFWIIILFSSFNVASRSFDKEQQGRDLYLYSLAGPWPVIFSKSVFNFLLQLVLSLFSLLIYMILLGTGPLASADLLAFCCGLAIGSAGIAVILTLVAGIAYKSENNIGLTAVLGFPVVLPFLLTLIRFSKNALDGIPWSVNYIYFLVLSAILVISLVLAYILFPYLWRD